MRMTATDQAYLDAIARAERRARNSVFDQHVVEDREHGYVAIDEGDYPSLPPALIEKIVHTVAGGLTDEH